MSCSNNEQGRSSGYGYVLVIVLYILLVIMLGPWGSY